MTIANVTNGASYEFGNVPVARCNVTDKEDGNSSFDASLSAITGARAAEGLGSQTASCNYDDAGGLNAKASATYSIVDTSKPLVTVDAPGRHRGHRRARPRSPSPPAPTTPSTATGRSPARPPAARRTPPAARSRWAPPR